MTSRWTKMKQKAYMSGFDEGKRVTKNVVNAMARLYNFQKFGFVSLGWLVGMFTFAILRFLGLF